MSFSLQTKIPGLSAALRKRAAALVFQTAKAAENAAKIAMTGQKSGKLYKRGKKKTHQASAPGEAPAVDTGTLRRSILTQRDGDLRAVVSVGAEYAVWLEFGTRRMAPRPFLGPAFEQVKPAFEAGLRGLLR